MEFYSGATGLPGRFNEGFLLRRLHLAVTRCRFLCATGVTWDTLDSLYRCYLQTELLQVVERKLDHHAERVNRRSSS
jgi:hypothetical protein